MCSDSPMLTQRSSSETFSLISHTSRFYSDASELVLHQSAYLITSNSQREMKDDKRRCSDSKPCNRRDPAGRTNLTPRSDFLLAAAVISTQSIQTNSRGITACGGIQSATILTKNNFLPCFCLIEYAQVD